MKKLTPEEVILRKEEFIGRTIYGHESGGIEFDRKIKDVVLEKDILTFDLGDFVIFGSVKYMEVYEDNKYFAFSIPYIGSYKIRKISITVEELADCKAWLPNLSKEELDKLSH